MCLWEAGNLLRFSSILAELSLHSFLHRGYSAFRKMTDVKLLINRLVTREQQVMRNILAGHPEPFSLPGDL